MANNFGSDMFAFLQFRYVLRIVRLSRKFDNYGIILSIIRRTCTWCFFIVAKYLSFSFKNNIDYLPSFSVFDIMLALSVPILCVLMSILD